MNEGFYDETWCREATQDELEEQIKLNKEIIFYLFQAKIAVKRGAWSLEELREFLLENYGEHLTGQFPPEEEVGKRAAHDFDLFERELERRERLCRAKQEFESLYCNKHEGSYIY